MDCFESMLVAYKCLLAAHPSTYLPMPVVVPSILWLFYLLVLIRLLLLLLQFLLRLCVDPGEKLQCLTKLIERGEQLRHNADSIEASPSPARREEQSGTPMVVGFPCVITYLSITSVWLQSLPSPLARLEGGDFEMNNFRSTFLSSGELKCRLGTPNHGFLAFLSKLVYFYMYTIHRHLYFDLLNWKSSIKFVSTTLMSIRPKSWRDRGDFNKMLETVHEINVYSST